ncbi:MAG: hypothetical protein JXL97_12065 [Bacteroidales bacterium]|nr:hypothetical protein [Bacteroidales bacterium]
MKKVVFSTLALVFAMFLFSSCGGNVEKDIVGKWKIETADLSNIDELVAEIAESFGLSDADIEEMKKEMKDGMYDEFVGQTIEFVEDHTVISPDSEGEWSYDSEKNAIVIKEGDMSYQLLVDKLSGDKFEGTMVVSDSGMDFKVVMTMSRQ